MKRIRTLVTAVALLGGALAVAPAPATVRSDAGDDAIARTVRFEPERGSVVPLDLAFRDAGGPVALAALTHGRPFILTMVWFACQNLCGLTLHGLADSLSDTRSRPGEAFDVIVLSLDPDELPAEAERRQRLLAAQYPDAGIDEAWHFVTATEPVVDLVAERIGFRYVYDTDKQQFAHPAGIVAFTAGGELSDYLSGINYTAPQVDRMLASLDGAPPPDRKHPVLLLCYDYDPQTGQYSFAILKALRLVAVLVVGCLAAFMLVSWYRERRVP